MTISFNSRKMKATIFILLTLSVFAYCQQCNFNINGYKAGVKPPLFVDQALGLMRYPQTDGTIVMKKDESIVLMCGSFSVLPGSTATLYCNGSTTFYYMSGSKKINTDIFDVTCQEWPQPSTNIQEKCMTNFQLIEVFYQFGSTHIPLYWSCYDPTTCLVHYVIYTINPLPNQLSNDISFKFRKGSLIKCDVLKYYEVKEQKTTFEKIFPGQGQNYINEKEFQNLEKGKSSLHNNCHISNLIISRSSRSQS